MSHSTSILCTSDDSRRKAGMVDAAFAGIVGRFTGWDLSRGKWGRPVYQAALIASIRHLHFRAYFTNKLQGRAQEPRIKTKMRVKLAAKLLIMAWTLMKKKEPFNPDYSKIE